MASGSAIGYLTDLRCGAGLLAACAVLACPGLNGDCAHRASGFSRGPGVPASPLCCTRCRRPYKRLVKPIPHAVWCGMLSGWLLKLLGPHGTLGIACEGSFAPVLGRVAPSLPWPAVVQVAGRGGVVFWGSLVGGPCLGDLEGRPCLVCRLVELPLQGARSALPVRAACREAQFEVALGCTGWLAQAAPQGDSKKPGAWACTLLCTWPAQARGCWLAGHSGGG